MPSQVAKYITRCMRDAGMNQEGLADAVGVSQPTVSRWVRGVNVPIPEQAVQLEQALPEFSAETMAQLAVKDARRKAS